MRLREVWRLYLLGPSLTSFLCEISVLVRAVRPRAVNLSDLITIEIWSIQEITSRISSHSRYFIHINNRCFSFYITAVLRQVLKIRLVNLIADCCNFSSWFSGIFRSILKGFSLKHFFFSTLLRTNTTRRILNERSNRRFNDVVLDGPWSWCMAPIEETCTSQRWW